MHGIVNINSMDRTSLGHAYLFVSFDRDALYQEALDFCLRAIGNDEMTESDAAVLRRRLNDGFYPDLLTVAAQGASLKIEQVRGIGEFFSYNALEGTYKFAIVRDADKMGEAAQNALLKTLEEPYDNRILILLALNTDNLLPTIISRVQTINIGGYDYENTVSDKDKELIREKIEKIILAGDVSEVFLLSDIIAKDRAQAQVFLEYIYDYLCFESTLFSNVIKYKFGEKIRNALKSIKQNSSVILTVQALLIRLQEEYNAENSRG